MENKKELELLQAQNWTALLGLFQKIERDEREKYVKLKELAKTKALTPNQMDGILARCDYRISLIDNPDKEPFANNERQEKRLHLSKEQSNGKP